MADLVNLDDVPLQEREHARAGLFRARSLLNGPEGTPENFYLQLSCTYSDFHSPRHRHNFDQVRVQLEGDADFARNGIMKAGMVGYFPEGVYYGPQSVEGESTTLVLQFGGASGSGYISEARFQQGVEELKQFGTFDNGVFRRAKDDGGRKSQDAYEAVWEHIHGRKLEYPKSDVEEPVFMDPVACAWAEESGLAGVRRKHLGTFSARKTRLSIIGIEEGAEASLAAHSLVFVLAGRGLMHEREWRLHATLRTGDAPERVVAIEASELLEIHIPPLQAS